ncbi:MAG: tRNA modification GTPase [Planctomycetota bacterium]|jgi:tRNA modification GTPase
MYQLGDTITAVSSPTADQRVIIRISGPRTIEVLRHVFSPAADAEAGCIVSGTVTIDSGLSVDAELYLFRAANSYTGQDVAELHIFTNCPVSERLMSNLLDHGLRLAGPGEFTARAYLNGKMDLSQAEAVNEIIIGSNRFQLAAGEKLLEGRLGKTTENVRSNIADCLSLIEAGLDFSEEGIEFITRPAVLERLTRIKNGLEHLLSGSVSYEELADLPAVGIAGAPNAGKSSLLNKLLGRERSIVSDQRKTTRDVLTGVLTLKHCRCVLFDCAGLTPEPKNILDELAQEAAIEALRKSSAVIFCVDGSKHDYGEDMAIRELIEPQILMAAATRADLVSADALAKRLKTLNALFGAEFVLVSTRTGVGLDRLRKTVDASLVDAGYSVTDSRAAGVQQDSHQTVSVALTARHRRAITEAIDNVTESARELEAGNDEVTAMLLRAAWQTLSTIEQEPIDEQILERIFSRFCIGK